MIDTRIQKAVITVNHGEAVENVIMFPSSNIFISCGGNSIKIWDVLKGGNLMQTIINHHKTVTSLAFSDNNRYLLSTGLDRLNIIKRSKLKIWINKMRCFYNRIYFLKIIYKW